MNTKDTYTEVYMGVFMQKNKRKVGAFYEEIAKEPDWICGVCFAPWEQDSIEEMYEKLPEKYRVPVLLFYYYGYSCEEIGKILKISHAAVRTRLKRARNSLKTELEEVWSNE